MVAGDVATRWAQKRFDAAVEWLVAQQTFQLPFDGAGREGARAGSPAGVRRLRQRRCSTIALILRLARSPLAQPDP